MYDPHGAISKIVVYWDPLPLFGPLIPNPVSKIPETPLGEREIQNFELSKAIPYT
jgi:hypothetical protein